MGKWARQVTDALCVPVIHDRQTLGAVHMYLGHGSFRDIDFDFAISVSQVLAVALARSRRQATLAADHQRLVASSAESDELLGESDAMLKLKETISKVARATGCVLVRGESGSGMFSTTCRRMSLAPGVGGSQETSAKGGGGRLVIGRD